jgi:cytochrome c-type biogenesis protein CcmH
MMLGTPQMVEFDAAKPTAQSANNSGQMPSVDEMVLALKKRLEEKPDDAQGWFLLGRTYMAMQNYPQAAEAYETLLKITGEEPTIMLSLAEAITFPTKVVCRAVRQS